MRRLTLILAMLLFASTAQAGQAAKRMMVVISSGVVPFTINGYTAITSDSAESGGTFALNDTGTENGISTGAGNISVKAYCTATTLNLANVYLSIDGSTAASLSCDYSESKIETISAAVSAGTHNIRVYGTVGDIDAYFSADTFRKPTP